MTRLDEQKKEADFLITGIVNSNYIIKIQNEKILNDNRFKFVKTFDNGNKEITCKNMQILKACFLKWLTDF